MDRIILNSYEYYRVYHNEFAKNHINGIKWSHKTSFGRI